MTDHLSNETRRARLWTRHHLDQPAPDALAAVQAVVAMHSSDPITPHLGLWARVAGYATEHLNDAIVAQTLWRMHTMRGTLWVVDAGEAAMFDGAAGRAVAARQRKRLLRYAAAEREDAATWLDAMERDVLAMLQDAPDTPTRTLSAALPDLTAKLSLGSGKWVTRTSVGPRLLNLLAMEGKLARTLPVGSWRASQYAWSVRDEGFGATRDEAQAQAALLRRYIDRFGPVTFDDMKWWTGWTVRHTRRALAALDTRAVSLEGGLEGFLLVRHDQEDGGEGRLAETPARGVALLPGLDPASMGYRDRDWYLGDHTPHLFDRNGNVGPTVWVDGRVVGLWSVREGGVVVTQLFEAVAPEAEEALATRAASLTTWLDGTTVRPMFPNPTERALAGG